MWWSEIFIIMSLKEEIRNLVNTVLMPLLRTERMLRTMTMNELIQWTYLCFHFN